MSSGVKLILMETLPGGVPPRPLFVVAGNLALDFANTVDYPTEPARFDHIQDVPRLLTWARNMTLLSAEQHDELAALASSRPAVAAASLRRAHLLRRTVQVVFGAIADDQRLPEQPWRELRRAIADAIGHADLRIDHDRVHFVWDGASLDSVIWPVAYAAHELLTGSQLSRVKRCAACPWLYVDQSKNSSRRWCTMDDCGKNVKMRRYVERRAARRHNV
jgi:predicted RNA-binding Zn ribbon-like protein